MDDMEYPRGRGSQVEKAWKFQGMGEYHEAPWNGDSLGGGGQTKNETFWGGGDGHFLEPHIECFIA